MKTYAEKFAPLNSSAEPSLLLGLLAAEVQGGVEGHPERGNLPLPRILGFQHLHIGPLSEVSVFSFPALLGLIRSPPIEQVAGQCFIILLPPASLAAGCPRVRKEVVR